MKMKYTFYNDPGHGWMKVPVKRLIELGIDQQISPYSYLSETGKFAYLEEDLDAGVFINAAKESGEDVTWSNRYADRSSRIRTYPGYQPEWVANNREALLA
jgi:hypothetical protein